MSNKIEYRINETIKRKTGERLAFWQSENYNRRIWQKEPAIWRKEPALQKELADRLGWLDLAIKMQNEIESLENFAAGIKDEFDDVVLLGMGGSSLAPEVYFKTYGNRAGFPKLTILDSTHPLSVIGIINNFNLKRTLFIVASKSGGTVETMSFFHTFYYEVSKLSAEPGKHFISITDPGSGLEQLSAEKKFRKNFSSPHDVGGRYSAMTYFGMVPAALIGADLKLFLRNAEVITNECGPEIAVAENPGFYLGALLGELALEGKDKLTFFLSPKISSFAVWVEQLIAESTGKDGVGIIPIADEEYSGTEYYGSDRVFVFLELAGDNNDSLEKIRSEITSKNFPVIDIKLDDLYSLAQEFYRWEMATAMAGAALNIHPFDQPNVQLAKTLAAESLNLYKSSGTISQENPLFTTGNLSFFGDLKSTRPSEALGSFLSGISSGEFIAVNAFVPMTRPIEEKLQQFRISLRNKYKVATTVGFGPRFLHSTGQLHKGGKNNGYFIEITSDIREDLEVPEQGYSYGVLVSAQALGDFKALKSKERSVLRINISGNIDEGLKSLIELA